MKNLRHLLRRSGLLSSDQRHRRSERARRSHASRRRLRSEVLEQRQLLAGDVMNLEGLAPDHNYHNGYDVNDDGYITARDALGIVNLLGRVGGEAEAVDPDAPQMFYDVNADHNITAADALGVINAMSRGEEVGELLELILTARDLNDQPIAPDANGDINVQVGQVFDLEVSYDDLRTFSDRKGAFNIYTDLSLSQSGVLSPVFNETQRLLVDSTITSVGSTGLTFSIPTAPPGISGGSLTYVSPIDDFANGSENEIANALLAFGYTRDQFTVSELSIGNVIGDTTILDDDLGYEVHWVGFDEFGNIDLPNITVDVNETDPTEVPTRTDEFGPFLADGVTPNPSSAKFNIITESRTLNSPSDDEELYSKFPRGQFDQTDGFIDVGGLTENIGATRIQELSNDGSFREPFDAFSLRVFVNQPVTDLVVGVNPGEDREAGLLFGRDDPLTQDEYLVESVDSTSNGIANVTINTVGSNQNPVVSGPITQTFTEDDAQANVNLLLGASDPDGNTLSISTPTISGNQAGIAVSGSTLTVTPMAYGALNDDQSEVITLNYNVLDGNGGTVAQTATINITGITDDGNQNPVVSGPITQTFTEDNAQANVNLLLSASDPDGDTLSISAPTISGNQAGIAVSGSTLTVTPTAYDSLNTGQSEIITLSYDVLDGNGGTVAQTATITITGITENQNPIVSGPISQTFTEDNSPANVNLLQGASDPDGDTLSISTPTISGNQAGIAVSGSTLTVTPSAYGALDTGQSEIITLSYNVLDGNGGSVTQTATITVTGITDIVNQPPVVSGPVTQTFSEDDNSGSVSLLTGASDPENDPLTVSNVSLTSGDGSGITVSGNSLIVNPAAYNSLVGGATSNVVYQYSISDGINNPVTQTATVTITGVNDPPVARNDSATVLVDTTARIQVLANDDAGGGENQTLTIVAASSANGSTTPNGDGTISFTPTTGFVGNTTISYTIQDSQGAQASATVNVAVQNFESSSLSGAVFIDHVENLGEIIAGGTPIRNGVKDADENGLTGVLIKLTSSAAENSTGQDVNLTAITDIHGSFRFEGLAPGTYRVMYEVPNTVIFVGAGSYIATIPEAGGIHETGLDFALHATQGDALDTVDILVSSYLRTNATMAQISDGGREGGLVSLDANGNQNFMIAFSGFEDAVFAEFVLNSQQDAALLTIVEEDGDVLTARLTEDHFVLTPNGRGVQFFGGMNDFDFFEADGSAEQEFANFRNAIDQLLGGS